jgi:hypothetical protein
MARSKLEESVISSYVIVGISYKDVLVSDIRRHHRKAYERAQPGCDLTFDRAAGVCWNVFVADDPLGTEHV